MTEYLTSAEVATILRIKVETIHSKNHHGTLSLPCIKSGNRLLFKKSDLEKYLASLEKKAPDNIIELKKHRIKVEKNEQVKPLRRIKVK